MKIMKIRIETIIGLSLILLVLLSGCIMPGCIQGSGNYTTVNKTVDNFSSIDLSGVGDVYLSQGPRHLSIVAEDNIIRELKTDVIGNRLIISHTAACVSPQRPIKIYTSTPDIESLYVSGSGRIIGLSPINSDVLSIGINGSGNINLDIICRDLSTTISGSGSAVLKGRAMNSGVNISGSGAVHSYDLETNRTEVTIDGSGIAEVNAFDELNALVLGRGNVFHKGDPDEDQRGLCRLK